MKQWKVRLITLIAYCLVKVLYATLRLQVVNEEAIEQERQRTGRGVVLASWHGRTFIPIARFAGRGYYAMTSTSRDGELQNGLLTRFGFQTIRGSTSARGAVAAALTMSKQLRKGGVIVLTPDGPRGPLHHVHGGVIFLAEKSGGKLIPAGLSIWPRVTFKTWDRYIIPYPFAKAALVFGDPIEVPAKLSEEEREAWGAQFAEKINALEERAEAMVCAVRKPNAVRSGASV
jgi:lysophospholipid acyltransferase (LPLAT)-like uncharacterized protein